MPRGATRGPEPGRRQGTRPTGTEDPVSGDAAVTVCFVAAGAPLLSMPVLADIAPAVVDSCTVTFLLKVAHQKEEEKERRRKQLDPAHERRMQELDGQVNADDRLTPAESCAWAGHLPSQQKRRKRKKRRKRSSPSPLPCDPLVV